MYVLNVPTEHMTLKGLHCLLLLLFPKIRTTKDLINSVYYEMVAYQDEIWAPFNLVFLENTRSRREKFFSNKLAMFLWQFIFFKMSPYLIPNYLKDLQ